MEVEIEKLEKGRAIEIKWKLITYDIYNIDNENYEVSQTSHGWSSVQIKKEKLLDCIKKQSFASVF